MTLKNSLGVLMVLLATCKTFHANDEIMQNHIEKLLTRVVMKKQWNFLMWFDNIKETNEWQISANAQTVIFNNDAPFEEVTLGLKSLHVKHLQTAIVVDDRANLTRLVRVTINLRHIIVFIGSEEPPMNILSMAKSPVVWMQNQPDEVSFYCWAFVQLWGNLFLFRISQQSSCSAQKLEGQLYLVTKL